MGWEAVLALFLVLSLYAGVRAMREGQLKGIPLRFFQALVILIAAGFIGIFLSALLGR